MLAIGQVAEATGLTNSAIRYYESVGLIPETTRLGGNAVILKKLSSD